MRNKAKSRTCCGCREICEKETLLRVVKRNDGTVMFDRSGKSEGRGVYVCANEKCIKRALKTRAFDRSLKVSVPSEIYNEIEKEIADASE